MEVIGVWFIGAFVTAGVLLSALPVPRRWEWLAFAGLCLLWPITWSAGLVIAAGAAGRD